MTVTYTNEQADVLNYITHNDGILLVEAGAGCGKTFMARNIVRELEPATTLYTAFNKGIVTEGTTNFRNYPVDCRTIHSLAYKYANPEKRNIQELGYDCIEEDVSYFDKSIVIDAINKFFLSSSADMYDFLDSYIDDEHQELKELSVKYITQMLHKEISPTFSFLLKSFHLMLANKSIECKYDLVILDEINDTTAVALEIFKLIDAPKKLGLGETNQAIYQFMSLVNGFEELDAPVLRLTHSFRCSSSIASRIENFMKKEANAEFSFSGTDDPLANGKTLHCTLTNAKIVKEIVACLVAKKGFHTLRKVSEIFSHPMAIITAGRGKEVYKKEHKYLEKEYKKYLLTKSKGYSFNQHLLDHVGDQETISSVQLLQTLRRKNINIFDVYKEAKENTPDEKYTIATVFTSKGLEFENVIISDDLNNRINTIRDNGGIKDEEDLVAYRCYYVACSRAGKVLSNASCLIS